MNEDQPLSPPQLVYAPRAASSHGAVRTGICGSVALFFSVAVFIATVIESHGMRKWRGPEVVALWICLISTPILSLVALISGGRRLIDKDKRETITIVGVCAAVAALLVLVCWLVYITW
jgi:uncharacterized membrane protein